MNASVNRQILLVEKPSGKLGPEHFKLTNGAMPEPKDGEALLKVRYISLDAANRAVVVELIDSKKRQGVAMVAIVHDDEIRHLIADRIVDVTSFAAAA